MLYLFALKSENNCIFHEQNNLYLVTGRGVTGKNRYKSVIFREKLFWQRFLCTNVINFQDRLGFEAGSRSSRKLTE